MGLFIAIAIILVWLAHLLYALFFVEVSASNPWMYLHILVQAYLFTGLFMTGHDAMHGTVKPHNKRVNTVVGHLASFLYAALSFNRLKKNHQKHHDYPGMPEDPDFCTRSQNFFAWYGCFMWRYVTIWQILIMAAIFNILLIWFNEPRLILLWIVPAFLSTFQMFFYGVWSPHRKPHDDTMEPYNARTIPKNHFRAMLSCYFFGYHYEHHQSPWTPWWKLYQTKQQ